MAVTILCAQNDRTLNSVPQKSDAVKLSLVKTISGEPNGFYNRVSVSMAPNGMVVVGDQGNKLVYVYNKDFTLQKTFGTEGSGPGEIDNISKIKATNDRIYVTTFSKIIVFTFAGEALKDVSLYEHGSGDVFISDKGIMFFYSDGKYTQVNYDKDGTLLKMVENEAYQEVKDQSGSKMIMRITSSNEKYVPYLSGYVSSERGSYQLRLLDKNFQVKTHISRPFDRIARDFSQFKFSFKADGVSKKREAEMAKAAQAQMRSTLGEFKDDVRGILGVSNGYIFVSVANEDDEQLFVDVISKDLKLFSQVVLPSEEDRELLSALVQGDKLLVCFKNEEIGPFINVYSIKIN
jgi:hypothetical protein